VFVLAVLALVVLIGSAAGSRTTRADDPTAASVDAKLQRIWTKYKSQFQGRGMCLGASDDGINRIKCFGKKAPGGNTPPNAHTLFHIASISKTFGATLLALRVEQGKVHLLDPVRTYVPNAEKGLFPKAGATPGLTLVDLAQHYSGLPHGTPSATSVDDLLQKTGDCLILSTCHVHPPETTYSYSNWGVAVLGTLLAVDDGYPDGSIGPWSADNRHAITGPLGMSETRSWQDWLKNDPTTFQAHRASTGSEQFQQSPYESPGSGVWSSPYDMLIWLRYSMGLAGSGDLAAAVPFLYDDPSDNTRPTKHAPTTIGLVWKIDPGTGGSCISKAGDGGDFHAYFVFLDRKSEPAGDKQRRGVFLLVTKTPTTNYRAIATELLNSLPTKTGEQKPTCPIPSSTSVDDG
jgi:D-alanyl-D-alanine-carboxypeptidase/D-alanyl-D-alanine-endopeptidase